MPLRIMHDPSFVARATRRNKACRTSRKCHIESGYSGSQKKANRLGWLFSDAQSNFQSHLFDKFLIYSENLQLPMSDVTICENNAIDL